MSSPSGIPRTEVGVFPRLVALHGTVPLGFAGTAARQQLVFVSPSGRVVPVPEPAGGAWPGQSLRFEIPDEDVTLDATVPESWSEGDRVTATLASGAVVELIAPAGTSAGAELEFLLPLSELVAELDGAPLRIEELPPPPPPPPPPQPTTIVMPPYPQPDSEALTRAVANAMAAAAEVAAGNNDALHRAIRELGDRVDGIGSRVDGLSGEVKSCRAALVLSQEESERRLSAGQREAAETTCETMLSGVQRMLDELRRALAAEKPPQPPPKPSVADRGVQAGGRERAVQAGGVDDSTQHDPLLEDGACQTDAPPSARPLVVPLALTVPASVSRAVSPPRPRKPADIYWYHQVHSAPPGSVQGRYVRQ